jgi:hypothetical protein
MIISNVHPTITMEVVTDPAEVAAAKALRERYRRNSDWFQAHLEEIAAAHNHKYVCVAGEELFVGDTLEAVLAQARAACSEDEGAFYVRYVRTEKVWRIYAHRRSLEAGAGR